MSIPTENISKTVYLYSNSKKTRYDKRISHAYSPFSTNSGRTSGTDNRALERRRYHTFYKSLPEIGAIKDQLDKLTELRKRKETILATIEEQEKLTPELRKRIEESWDSTEIEDLYLPYKPHRLRIKICAEADKFGVFVYTNKYSETGAVCQCFMPPKIAAL